MCSDIRLTIKNFYIVCHAIFIDFIFVSSLKMKLHSQWASENLELSKCWKRGAVFAEYTVAHS